MSKIWLISRLVILTFIWWILTKGAADSWAVGLPVILAAIYLDFHFFRPSNTRWSFGGSVAFALFFLKSSILSGLDVVRRTYHPRLPLRPAMIEYPLQLKSSAARNLFVCTVSLLPGTLSSGIAGHKLFVHVLDDSRPVDQELKIIENRVAAVFKQPELIDQPQTRIE